MGELAERRNGLLARTGPVIEELMQTASATTFLHKIYGGHTAPVLVTDTDGRRTVPSTVAESAMALRNSKNCVACTIEDGIGAELMSFICGSFPTARTDGLQRIHPDAKISDEVSQNDELVGPSRWDC